MKRSKRRTKFGTLEQFNLWSEDVPVLQTKFEVLEFRTAGSWHKHDVIEVAICLSGSGVVHVEAAEGSHRRGRARQHGVLPGDMVKIRPGASHYMSPDRDGMKMLIVYHANEVHLDGPPPD